MTCRRLGGVVSSCLLRGKRDGGKNNKENQGPKTNNGVPGKGGKTAQRPTKEMLKSNTLD